MVMDTAMVITQKERKKRIKLKIEFKKNPLE